MHPLSDGVSFAGPPKPFYRIDQWPLPFSSVYRLMDGFRSAITGMFSDDGPLSGNAARKMD